MTGRIKAPNLADKVYFTLKNMIIRGEMKPGDALREEYLSQTFNVSRTPLRKALTQLLAEGYLARGGDRTLRIPRISEDEFADFMAARKLLEVTATYDAAANANDNNCMRLEHYIMDQEEALKTHDKPLAISIDRMFHNYLAQMSHNHVYADFITQIEYKVSLYLTLSNTLGDPMDEAVAEHREILRTVRLKMPERAGKAMETHLNSVIRRIRESLKNNQ